MVEKFGQMMLRGDRMAFAVGVVLAVLLWLVVRSSTSPLRRSRLRMPLVLLGIYVVLSVIAEFAPLRASGRQRLEIIALFPLLLALGRLLTMILLDWFAGRRLGRVTPKIIRDIVEGLLVVVALLATLTVAGVDGVSLLTTSALLTAIIGLSLQDTLGNLFAGLSLQAQQPFTVGEWIQVDREGHQVGQVLEINWRATRVRTIDAEELVIPNGQLARTAILNHSRPGRTVRRSILVTIPHEFSPQRVQEVILKAIAYVPGAAAQPEPTVMTHGFTDHGVQYAVRYFIEDFGKRELLDATMRDRLWEALDRAGLPFATPHARASRKADVNAEAAAGGVLKARQQALRTLDFLRDLPESAIETLASDARNEHYGPGELIVRQGEPGEDLYLCLSGELVVLHSAGTGPRREIARLYHGGMFGEFAQMTGEPRRATVQAVTACELVVVGKHAFSQILSSNPQFTELITQRLAERLATLEASGEETPEQQRASAEQHKGQLLRRLRAFFAI